MHSNIPQSNRLAVQGCMRRWPRFIILPVQRGHVCMRRQREGRAATHIPDVQQTLSQGHRDQNNGCRGRILPK